MSLLDLSNYHPLRFGAVSEPARYDYDSIEPLVKLLTRAFVQPMLELLVDEYALEYFAYGTEVDGKSRLRYAEPLAERVSLHPHLFLLCLRCEELRSSNLVHRDHLVRHLEAEVLRRKLKALLA